MIMLGHPPVLVCRHMLTTFQRGKFLTQSRISRADNCLSSVRHLKFAEDI
jgi:hypothetical protein